MHGEKWTYGRVKTTYVAGGRPAANLSQTLQSLNGGIYVQWFEGLVLFHKRRYPHELGKVEIEMFLTHLAIEPQLGCRTGFGQEVFMQYALTQKYARCLRQSSHSAKGR